MLLDRPFQALTPTVDGDVLSVLAGADASFTAGDVHRILGRHSVAGVRLALNRLVEQGIVGASAAGRAFLYRLNREHVLAGAVLEIARAKSSIVERLQAELGGWRSPSVYAALFGSAATNDMSVDSDVDVLVVRSDAVAADEAAWRSQVDQLAERCTNWTGNDCQVLELSEHETQGGSPVVVEIAQTGITLAGSSTFLSQAGR